MLQLSVLTRQKRALTCLCHYGYLEKSTGTTEGFFTVVQMWSLCVFVQDLFSSSLTVLVLCSFLFFPSRVPSAVVTRLHQTARRQRVQVLCCWQTLDEHTGKDLQLSLLSCKHKDSKTQKCYSLRLMYFYLLCVHPCLMNRLCVTS